MSANEKAEAILIVIKRLFKWFAFGVGGLIALCVVIYAISEVSDWYSKDRHKAKVKVGASFNPEKCDAAHPVYVGIVNDSTKTITNFSIYLKITRDGYSKTLNKSYEPLNSDFIVKPGVGAQSCWGVYSDDYNNPKLLDGKNMQVEVDHFYVTFKDN